MTVEQHDRQRPFTHIFVSFCIFVLLIFFSHGQVSVSTERSAEKEDRADASGESKDFRIKKKDRTCRKPALRSKKEPANSNHKYFSATAFSVMKMMLVDSTYFLSPV